MLLTTIGLVVIVIYLFGQVRLLRGRVDELERRRS